MTGTHSVPWKKLDPQELRQKLMGYGEHTMNHEEPKVKLSGKGIFQKRMSTAPGSTLPRPFLSDISISSPISVSKQPVFLPNQITSTQSHTDLGFDRKRVMRRSRSAQGLVGPLSEYKMDMRIKRKPVPRISGQIPIRSEPHIARDDGIISREKPPQFTRSHGHLPQSSPNTGQPLDISHAASTHLDPYPFFNNTSQTLPNITQIDASAPTIATTFTSGSLNLGLDSSESSSSLASSEIIDTPTKRSAYHSNTSEELKTPSLLSSRRYESVGMRLDQYMGPKGLEKYGNDHSGSAIEEVPKDEVLRPTIRISSSSTEDRSLDCQPETPASLTSQSTGSLYSSTQNPKLAPPALRPGRAPGLFLDLSHLKPFASTLLPLSPTTCDGTSTPLSDSNRLNMPSRTTDHPDYTASSESSFAALRKDSLDSPFIRSVRSSIGHSGMISGEGLGWRTARSHLVNEVGYQSDTEEESEGTKTAILSAEALAALDETPKASLRGDPFVARPTSQHVREWTDTLKSESTGPVRPDYLDSRSKEHEGMKPKLEGGGHSQEQLTENIERGVATRPSRGNRAERLIDDGRASRTGYWDYSIIRGGHATPPPPEFFSTFQGSPKTPTLGTEATFKPQYDSPAKPSHSSPLRKKTNADEIREQFDEDEESDPIGPDPMLTPERKIKRVSVGSQAMTTPQRLLKYGMDVLTSPVKLLSPRTNMQNRLNREESSSLLEYVQGMGHLERQYSSPSEYDVDDSPMSRYEDFEKVSYGTPRSMPLFEAKYTFQPNDSITTAVSLGAGIGISDQSSGDNSRARPSELERLREVSVAVSGSSKLDSLSQLDIGVLPAEYSAYATGTQVAQFNNGPPVFHFPSPPPSDRHQSIFSMLSGTSGSQSIPRGSHGALLAAQMNEARKQQRQEHLIVLEPAVDIKGRPESNPDQKLQVSPGQDQVKYATNNSNWRPSPLSPSELFVISTPPPRKRCSAFADAESSDTENTIDTPIQEPQLLTPKRLPLSAAIAAHGPAISIISPDRNSPRLRSNIAHESPRSLPTAGSRRDIPSYPKDGLDDVLSRTPLLSTADRSSLAIEVKSHNSSTYRDDIRLRPLHVILNDKAKDINSQPSFTPSSQQSEQEDDLPAPRARWDDVYCACFGRRIC